MTKKQIENTTKVLQGYCDRLNEHMPCKSQEDVDVLYNILDELFDTIKGSYLYWSRKIFIDSYFNDEKCSYIMTHKQCMFVPIYDIEEHIGVKVIYKYEKEAEA